MKELDVWSEVPRTEATSKVIPCRWVFKTKRHDDGRVDRYKARLVAKGFKQKGGVDFAEVWAPVSKHTTLRALLATVVKRDWEMHQIDVSTAFLYGKLDDDAPIFLEPPPGFASTDSDFVCKLNRSIYGLRQAPRAWHFRLKTELARIGLRPSSADPALWLGKDVLLLLYVDDALIASPALKTVEKVKQVLGRVFKLRDLKEPRVFLSLSIQRDRGAGTLKVSQAHYVAQILAKFNMQDSIARSVPMASGTKTTKTGQGMDDNVLYGSLVGALMYLAVCTRPDIAYAVGQLARYMAGPTEEHWTLAKSVLKYLRGSADLGIVFGSRDGISGFVDADFAGCVDTRRSTTGYVFIMHGGAVSWASRTQPTVATSTCEAEYMAAGTAVREALWFRKVLMDLSYDVGSMEIRGDNQAALKLLENPVNQSRSKHIDVVHYFARERVESGEVFFSFCPSKDNVADCFTKALGETLFKRCVVGLGLCGKRIV
jgi:hypothetical protein